MGPQAETAAVMACVAAACAVPGVFLVLRRQVMVTDAISHVLLFGIVLAYFAVKDLMSPWLFAGATASGILTVALVELLRSSNRVKEDAAIGLIFPALFSIATILASLYLRDTHLDIDSVLLGHAEFASFDRVWGLPRGIVVLGGLFLLNAGLTGLFFKELKLTAFDPLLAASLGFVPVLMHYALMTIVSITAVAAFDAVGPVLVVAFFAVPAATAYLVADRLAVVIALSVAFAVVGGIAGTLIAFYFDTNIAGTVATTLGAVFASVLAVRSAGRAA